MEAFREVVEDEKYRSEPNYPRFKYLCPISNQWLYYFDVGDAAKDAALCSNREKHFCHRGGESE